MDDLRRTILAVSAVGLILAGATYLRPVAFFDSHLAVAIRTELRIGNRPITRIDLGSMGSRTAETSGISI